MCRDFLSLYLFFKTGIHIDQVQTDCKWQIANRHKSKAKYSFFVHILFPILVKMKWQNAPFSGISIYGKIEFMGCNIFLILENTLHRLKYCFLRNWIFSANPNECLVRNSCCHGGKTYSFISILTWNILLLKKPFDKMK